VTPDDLRDRWQAALDLYDAIDAPVAKFNSALIRALRPNWEDRVRIVTSVVTLWFTHPETTYPFEARVQVEYEADDRVSVSLRKLVPRRDLTHTGGVFVVSGDFVRPENAAPVVESFLMQVAAPEA
jgi:hypothetical protein